MILKDPLAGGREWAGAWQACGVHHSGGVELPPGRTPRMIFPLPLMPLFSTTTKYEFGNQTRERGWEWGGR